jgi:hypothetical protein
MLHTAHYRTKKREPKIAEEEERKEAGRPMAKR